MARSPAELIYEIQDGGWIEDAELRALAFLIDREFVRVVGQIGEILDGAALSPEAKKSVDHLIRQHASLMNAPLDQRLIDAVPPVRKGFPQNA